VAFCGWWQAAAGSWRAWAAERDGQSRVESMLGKGTEKRVCVEPQK